MHIPKEILEKLKHKETKQKPVSETEDIKDNKVKEKRKLINKEKKQKKLDNEINNLMQRSIIKWKDVVEIQDKYGTKCY